MTAQNSRADNSLHNSLSTNILPTSATMIGVCMTVLSIGHLGSSSYIRMTIDKILAVGALIFLASALLSFMSMRTRWSGIRYEVRAETIFISGLGLLVFGTAALAFMITNLYIIEDSAALS